MFQRAFMIGLLSVLPMLGSGCQLGPSEPAKAGNSAPDRAAVPADERPEAQAEPAQAEKSAKTREVTVAVTGMTWPVGWPARVRKALTSLPWVRKVQVDFGKKQAIVTAEADKYDEKALLKALEKESFGGKVVK